MYPIWSGRLSTKETQLSSVDFVVNRFFMKLFRTSNIEVVKYCQEQFVFELPSSTLARRTKVFLDKLRQCDNSVIKMICT